MDPKDSKLPTDEEALYDLSKSNYMSILEAGPSKSFSASVARAGTPSSGGKKKLSMRKLSVEAAADLPWNDDCSELKEEKERSNAELEKSMNKSSNKVEEERELSFTASMTKEQMQEHVSRCLQLSTENKINTKNAFALKLIDYMTIITKSDDKSNFAAMACQLDAGAKIYSSRVDAVHQQVIKLVDTCMYAHKKNKEPGSQEDDDDEETSEHQGEGGEKEKEKKKKPKKKVIATFDQITRQPKESDPKDKFVKLEALPGDILSKAKYCPVDLSLTLDKSMPFWVDWQNYKPVKPEGDNELLDADDLDIENCSQDLHASPDEDLEFDLTSIPQLESLLHPKQDDEEEDSDDMDEEEDFSSSPYNAFPEEEDSPEVEVLTLAKSKMMERSNTPSANEVLKTVFHNTGESDYHYFKMDTSNFWAGPSHWKRPKGHNLAEIKRRAMRKKKEPTEVRYEKLLNEEKEGGKKVSIKKAPNLSQKTMDKWSTKKVTFPEFIEFEPQTYLTLFFMNTMASTVLDDPEENGGQNEDEAPNEEGDNDPNVSEDMFGEDNEPMPEPTDGMSGGSSPEFKGFSSSPVTSNLEEVVEFRGFPSSSESSPFDPEHGFKGFDSQEEQKVPTAFDNNAAGPSETPCDVYEGENLVPMVKTVKVDPIRIVAKPNRVDMQHLKKVMLDIIIKHIEDNENKLREEGSSSRGSVPFRDVLTELFGSDKLHRRTRDDLTVQMAFLCILTLANENNLSLTKDDTDDFVISMTDASP